MNIGDVAAQSGVSKKTIRYYEEVGLITPNRAANGYRTFREADLETLAFLSRARALGFAIEDCRKLLAFDSDAECECSQVKALAEAHLRSLEAKAAEIEAMRLSLTDLMSRCAGDESTDCPILGDLAGANESSEDEAAGTAALETTGARG
ncbi:MULTISPECIES: MerR family transcriptional regulator [unclassified Marinovum]